MGDALEDAREHGGDHGGKPGYDAHCGDPSALVVLPCTLQEEVHGHDHVAAVVQGLDDPDQEHDRTIGRKGGGKTAQEP